MIGELYGERTMTSIANQRLYNQRLEDAKFETVREVVDWLGAVQAQEYEPAKWSLALRMQNPDSDVIEQAFTEGAILRTHVMRPTWHFVLPADIRWMLELTAPRVNAFNAHMYRQFELDDALFAHTNSIIANALQGGKQLTRAELGAVLADAGIVTNAMRLSFIVFRAELDLIVCSGARRGKQHTYALLDERAPHAKSLPQDEALAQLTRRYYTSHGPATAKDFAWWSGLTVADAKAGLEIVGSQLLSEEIDGKTYWFSPSQALTIEPSQTAFLMPTFDEFLVGYEGFGKAIAGGEGATPKNQFYAALVLNGKVVGHWRRTLKSKSVIIEIAPLTAFMDAEREAIDAAAEQYGAFLGLPVTLQEV